MKNAICKVKAVDGAHKWLWDVGPTKGRKVRRVGVGERILRLLADLKQATTDTKGFVFQPKMAGLSETNYAFIDPDYFDSGIYGPIAMAADLPLVRFHDLRHFFASMLIAQGESPKYVCDQMGHSSIQVTFDTYGHLFPQARREASAKLEAAMFTSRTQRLVEALVEKAADKSVSDEQKKEVN